MYKNVKKTFLSHQHWSAVWSFVVYCQPTMTTIMTTNDDDGGNELADLNCFAYCQYLWRPSHCSLYYHCEMIQWLWPHYSIDDSFDNYFHSRYHYSHTHFVLYRKVHHLRNYFDYYYYSYYCYYCYSSCYCYLYCHLMMSYLHVVSALMIDLYHCVVSKVLYLTMNNCPSIVR